MNLLICFTFGNKKFENRKIKSPRNILLTNREIKFPRNIILLTNREIKFPRNANISRYRANRENFFPRKFLPLK